MSNTKREPTVIDLKPGESADVQTRWDGEQVTLSLRAVHDQSMPGGRGLAVYGLTGWMATHAWMPDPARTAVQAERERFDAAASAVLDSWWYDKLQAAIDAPAETVSEYERGEIDMRNRLIDAVVALKRFAHDGTYASVLNAMRHVEPLTEPASG